MKAAAPPGALPSRLRAAAALCVAISIVVGLAAAVSSLFFEKPDAARPPATEFLGQPVSPEMQAVQLKVEAALVAVGSELHQPGSFSLTALLLVSTFTCVVALRLLRPGLIPREGLRRMLVLGCGACALLTTLSGALFAVVMHRLGVAYQTVQLPLQPGVTAQDVKAQLEALPSIFAGLAMLLTAPFAGVYTLFYAYFGSPKVREQIQLHDVRAG